MRSQASVINCAATRGILMYSNTGCCVRTIPNLQQGSLTIYPLNLGLKGQGTPRNGSELLWASMVGRSLIQETPLFRSPVCSRFRFRSKKATQNNLAVIFGRDPKVKAEWWKELAVKGQGATLMEAPYPTRSSSREDKGTVSFFCSLFW